MDREPWYYYKGMQIAMSNLTTFNTQHDWTTNTFDSRSHLNSAHSSFLVWTALCNRKSAASVVMWIWVLLLILPLQALCHWQVSQAPLLTVFFFNYFFNFKHDLHTIEITFFGEECSSMSFSAHVDSWKHHQNQATEQSHRLQHFPHAASLYSNSPSPLSATFYPWKPLICSPSL